MREYRLLLAEDEDIIRHGLRHMIEKMGLGITVREAQDGVQALEICASEEIDLLLTDISMPRMDGLSLIAFLREQGNGMPCVIVSGYSEFEYARKAISFGVEEYLLKPIERADLRRVLEKAVSKLADAGRSPEEAQQLNSRLHQDFWSRALTEEHIHLSAEEEQLVAQAALPDNALLLLGMYKPGGALYSELLKLESGSGRVLCNYTSPCGYVFHLLCVPGAQAEAFRRAYLSLGGPEEAMLSALCAPCRSIEALPAAYRLCVNCLNARLLRRLPCVNDAIAQSTDRLGIPFHYFELIRDALELHDMARADAALHHLLEYLLGVDGITPELLIDCLQNLELFLLSRQSGQTLHLVPVRSRLGSLDYLLSSSETIDSFEEAVLLRIRFISSASVVSEGGSPIGVVLDYIDKHYMKDLSAVYCANLISMNNSYFSTYFKKKTGMTFINYLQRCRIRKSAELLRTTDLRIYEIAERVGFTDDKYFFKIFRQYFDLTPTEYRSLTDEAAARLSPPD